MKELACPMLKPHTPWLPTLQVVGDFFVCCGAAFHRLYIGPPLDIVNSSCDIWQMRDVIGFARVLLPRYTAIGQWRLMALNKVRNVIQKGERIQEANVPEDMKIILGDVSDLIRMGAPGRVYAVAHAHLLADPSLRGVRGGTRGDFWRVVDAIEAKGAIIWELYTGFRTDDPKQRDKLTRAAIDALALGRHKTRRSDKRGRPLKTFDDATKAKGEAVWFSRRWKTWASAGKRLPKGMTVWDAHELFGPRNVEQE